MDTNITNISVGDIPEAMQIIYQQGWKGYGGEDLQMILNISPSGCYKMVKDDKMIGFIFSLVADAIGYVSFFLIVKDHRAYSGGNELGTECLKSIKKNADTLIIYANKLAVNAYLRKGFLSLGLFRRYRFKGVHNIRFRNVSKHSREIIQSIEYLNNLCYRSIRSSIIDELFNYPEATCFIYKTSSGDIQGYLFSRKIDEGYILGPLVSSSDEAASNLLYSAIDQFAGYDLFADAPEEKCNFFLKEANIAADHLDLVVNKMYWGNKHGLENSELLYFIGGHHFS